MKIACAYSKIVSIDKIKPNPRNPNRHPSEQITLLAKNIATLGWRHPIIVSKRSGFVVAGHARLEAAHKLGLKSVPVDYQDFANAVEEHAYLIADNRIAELAELDNVAIKDLLEELDTGATDMDLTGYDSVELERLMTCDTSLKPIAIQKPPRMAWVLVGVPIGDWGKVSPLIEVASTIAGSTVETTTNDGIKEN